MTHELPADVQAADASTLVVRRTILARAERLFAAWTEPAEVMQWWGPDGVTCTVAEVDLRVGGRYRIANQFPDGKLVWIAGEFERIDPPHELVYSWHLGTDDAEPERVTVRLDPRGDATEVIVIHERIPTRAVCDEHEDGWRGCLDGLAEYVNDARASHGRD
jgi:uncharacterized protein YndB with AHSA1/START domain